MRKCKNLYNDYEKIWKCFNPSKNTKEMSNILRMDFLKNYKFNIDEFGNIFVGNFDKKRPCLVAHIDSVHLKPSTEIYFDGVILSSNNGIGGDDKCGIVAILEILKTNKNVNAIFTVDEEIGGIGASKIKYDDLKNILYFIEIDRKGNEDIIFQSGWDCLASDEFEYDIKSVMSGFGKLRGYKKLKENEGTFTDVNILSQTALKSAINVFAGYYNAHTSSEYVNLHNVQKSIDFVKMVLDNLNKVYPLVISYNSFNRYDNYKEYVSIDEIILKGYCLGMNEKQIALIEEAYYLGLEENN